ncbi:cbb3-type cytochrome c oxidase N-terminal domain-containing protein [Flavilitoribacter nigricans]|uniref:Cytochrome C oxidase subunit III n=1 Tax=Flavilitoribacter nigricans (strain ATCC 23147 / DSM 23189 / NBRC 102662 / NCIMB 1420 / SS-2) TaxID=1122177 RepID=A0A2D0N6T1_FLAN2|nr:cbb3-type cytochrome c oxidase N-terminal domain-containing protein [Flavilitoribacter nigricans]PHN03849.1 cytochrome C oxidase subunit III [Flavilitoribacter nigricans DSM 23189 = NBRC 102662]
MISRISYILILFSLPALATAQSSAAGGTVLDLIYQNFGLFFIFSIIVLAVVGMFSMFRTLASAQLSRIYQEKGLEEFKAAAKRPTQSFWTRMYKKWTAYVPVEKEKDIQLDHDYDGIKELDNQLPPWWVAMFYITIAFGVIYMTYYHVMDQGKLQIAQYEAEMEEAEEAVAAFVSRQADQVNENNVTLLAEEAPLAAGKDVFIGKCAACHGQAGEGGVGPNLTDQYWLHGGSINDVFKTIKYGVIEKGMIPWKDQLRAREIQEVASYILTLQGTNPPNGKEPQGELYDGPVESGAARDTIIGMK